MKPASRPARLLTFAPMIDSECTRLVMQHYRLPFDERDHIFGWASLLTLFHGGYGRVPLLYGGGVRGSGPRQVADRLDPKMGDRRLIPIDERARSSMERDWAKYNGELATHVAVVAYFYLLPAREAMIAGIRRPLHGVEQRLVRPVYPLLAALFGLLLRLNPQHVAKATAQMQEVLDHADDTLADGRRFLGGDRLTLADLGLVSASAPLLIPRRYEHLVPPFEQLPEPFQAIVRQTRQRPVADYAQRVIKAVEKQE